jgi:hypothetical protein
LDQWRNIAPPAIATPFLQIHTGDPGAAGSANISSVTTRKAITFAAAASGSMSANGTLPSWPTWAGTNNESVTHVSFHTASSGTGNFKRSAALSAPVVMATGNTLNITAITFTFTPVAA